MVNGFSMLIVDVVVRNFGNEEEASDAMDFDSITS